MFDHNIFQENLVGVDFCERMVAETDPGVLERANRTECAARGRARLPDIGDIMRSLNPLEGEFYREALQVSRSTREMFCLMEGRHVHPSTLYPGGVGTTATVQLFTDYLTRLMRYVEFMKRVVPMHDDLFDFFYEAMPGYEEVGRRRADLVCWGSLNDPEHCDFRYENMTNWGRKMFVSPGVIRDGELLRTNDLVEDQPGHPDPARLLVLRGLGRPGDVRDPGPARQPGRPRRPWNQHTIPRPGEARLRRQVQLGHVAALVRRHRPPGRGHRRRADRRGCGRPRSATWSTSLRCRSTGRQRGDQPAADVSKPRKVRSSGRSRGTRRARRCPTRSSATAPGPTSRPTRRRARCTSSRRRWPRSGPGGRRPGSRSASRTRRTAAGSPRRSAACCRTTW